jgi:hypothetical protein
MTSPHGRTQLLVRNCGAVQEDAKVAVSRASARTVHVTGKRPTVESFQHKLVLTPKSLADKIRFKSADEAMAAAISGLAPSAGGADTEAPDAAQ